MITMREVFNLFSFDSVLQVKRSVSGVNGPKSYIAIGIGLESSNVIKYKGLF